MIHRRTISERREGLRHTRPGSRRGQGAEQDSYPTGFEPLSSELLRKTHVLANVGRNAAEPGFLDHHRKRLGALPVKPGHS